ncbi:hypothetical protein PMZ80_002946 [Knufia obscura]|uniref:DH domain-containing protein n=1 Tax=Knufia obscura TaxID=1635080 RepID=A0ABR0RZU2_9EURO|nr:hypothetical protein PMZ80_002946 [Knufia obscura]
MAAVLQPAISNPFSTTPGPPSCRLDGPFSFPEHAPDPDTISINTVVRDRSRQASPASTFSVASAPLPRNDENISPLARLRNGDPQPRSASSHSPKSPEFGAFRAQLRPRNFTFQPLTQSVDLIKLPEERTNGAQAQLDQDDNPVAELCPRTQGKEHRTKAGPCPVTPAATRKHDETGEKSIKVADVKPLDHKRNMMVTPETGVLPRIRELRQKTISKESDASAPSPTPSQGLVHHQRLSDGSSGFVHSMKTASFTNASFSIFPRSSRMGKSTDSAVFHGSQPRHSIDSDRPMTGYSFDDLALKRGFKRQQIIDELIATEESYVADLKALVYLYSTLLASASSISNRLRSAIEQNVEGILHCHERIVKNLHSARLQAAARRWADTAVPARLGHHRRPNLRHSERDSHARASVLHRHTRSDESADVWGIHPQHSGSAEPIDVYEITAIFKGVVKEFYAYEEYCANFEIIGHELQKHMPQVWSTYESGMESLAKVIMAIDHRQANDHKSLTVGDLLIKPIQRLMRYPLLLGQLLNSTPVADAPGTHAELDLVLQSVREVVQMVNLARDNQYARIQIQRRWLLQDRLDLSRLNVTPEQFRSMGSVELCGVLHVAYQTTVGVNGAYALCALLDEHFLVALPIAHTGQFQAVALIQLSDIRIEAATDGKGLQCASTFFTWKISFACAGYYHELILSGCSKTEEDHWTAGLRGDFSDPVHHSIDTDLSVTTCLALDLKSVGVVFSSQNTLSRESSVQRAATVGGRPSIAQVIVRNTHNAQDLHEYRDPTSTASSINRSQSHMNTKRIPVLEPKRSERTRLESSVSDIWTKERLPFPGMVGSRGGQMLRASAGSLARKLSLASIHTPFSKGRTSSLSMASRKSYDLFNDAKSTFEIRRREPEYPQHNRMKPKEIPEVDDMRSVVGRMIGSGMPVPKRDHATGELHVDRSRDKKIRKASIRTVGPDDSAAVFYESSAGSGTGDGSSVMIETETMSVIAAEGGRRRKRRWSRPISKLKEFGSDAKSMLYSSSSGA